MKEFWEKLKSFKAGSAERMEFVKKTYCVNYSAQGVRLQYIEELIHAEKYFSARQLLVNTHISNKNKEWALPWFSRLCDIIRNIDMRPGEKNKNTMTKDKPDFLCIGAQKAGTSWLYVNLLRNGHIWMPPIKELHYFDHMFCPANRRWTTRHIQTLAAKILEKERISESGINEDYIKYIDTLATGNLFSEEWYKSAFSYCVDTTCIYGDITPEYSCLPEKGIEYIRKYYSPKIIYIIREPFSRIVSQLRMNALRKNFAIDADESQWKTLISELDHSRGDYKTYIPLWNKYFAEKDILYMPFGLITADSTKFLRTVEKFLDVENIAESEILKHKVWASKEYPIPESILNYCHEVTFEQSEFLRKNFSQEFINLI
jgi:hypothetical protein